MDPRPPDEPVRLGLGDPDAGIAEWIADRRVDDAAASRARRRWLERQAAEEATMSGVLADLGERGRPVLLRTRTGHVARGRIVALGADFVVVRDPGLGELIVPATGVASVQGAPGDDAPTGDRPWSSATTLAETLVELSADRPRVLVAAGDHEIRGELRSAGLDVIAVATEGDRRDVVHVRTLAIDHLVVLAR